MNKEIFNKRIFEGKLKNFNLKEIDQYEEKLKILNSWKYSIDNSDLNRTKEKQLQGKFLLDFFCKILNYKSMIGRDSWSFIQEEKTKADATMPDGVLGFFSKFYTDVRVVIELKDANTNLDEKQSNRRNYSPVEQAFSYAPKFGGKCRWVIVSNFKEIRLYNSRNALEYEKFEITNLNNEYEFKRFFYLLNYNNLINSTTDSVIDNLYKDNDENIKNITKVFYEEYKNTRLNLFKGIKENNDINELILFEKTQKLMDRFIFICFCEDKELLPRNTFKNVITTARNSFEPSDTKVFTQLKGLFKAINIGNPSMNINKFNGGLFADDDILDKLYIPDDLFNSLEDISEYDFDTDLNVNILGHIFEQSISDIEDIKNEIEHLDVSSKDSKRKKDGIFYTPEYVTNYIVEECIGAWLRDRRKELGEDKLPQISNIDNDINRKLNLRIKKKGKNKIDEAINKHIVFWQNYANVLSNIKILDPACGSGAFLNAAFDYLYKEGERVNRELLRLNNGQIYMFDLDKNILKNNLYGIDLNEESVELTKLSLWLKTANKREPLTSLDGNIICANSLIEDYNIVGEKAINWESSFASFNANEGFDIIIGNPPYGAKLTDKEKKYLDIAYKTTQYNYDTYKFFIELSFRLCKSNGYVGLITPNTYLILEKSNLLRDFLFDNYRLRKLIEIYNVFPDAIVEPIISIFQKSKAYLNEKFEVICVPRNVELSHNFAEYGTKNVFTQSELKSKHGYLFNYHETKIEKEISDKLDKISKPLADYLNVTTGIKPYQTNKGNPKQTKEVVKNKPFNGFEKVDDTWLPYMKGENIDRYTDKWNGEYIKYGEWLAEPRNDEIFKNEKIFIRQTSDRLIATFDNEGKIGKNTLHCIYRKDTQPDINLKVILGLINSKLLNWKFQHDNFHIVGKPLAETKVIYINRLPIVYPKNIKEFLSIVDNLLIENKKRFDEIKNFVKFIECRYSPKKISNKLLDFYKLEYSLFINELNRQKVKLTENEKFELFSLFNNEKEKISALDSKIDKLEKDLNKLVYDLYKLTDEEINIIEGK